MISVLEHGSVRLVESWGKGDAGKPEAGIIEAARQSRSGSFRGWEVEERLLRYLYTQKPPHCYDDQTEVLTRRGFVPWGEVVDGDMLGQWDSSANSLVYESAFGLIRQRHCGRMYKVDHGGVDLLVTANHGMFVKTIVKNESPGVRRQKWADEWSIISAADLGSKSMVRYRKHAARRVAGEIDLDATFPPHDSVAGLLRLIGFFIGDGHACRMNGKASANGVSFHLKKERKVAFLAEACAEIGWELSAMAGNNYVVRAPGITRIFREEFYDPDGQKRVPAYLLDMNVEDAEAMLDGLRASDGSLKRGAWRYSSTSRQVAESLQLLVLHAGGAAHVSHDGYIYSVMVLSRMTEPVINQGSKNTSWVDYDGEVFCATTRTGILVVRRNGKVVLSGNSGPFEFAGMTIEVVAPLFVLHQWQRHRTQSYAEASGRYGELPEDDYLPTVERLLQDGGKNKQAKGAASVDPVDAERAGWWLAQLRDLQGDADGLYARGIAAGIPYEVARLAVTVGRYSQMRASANLRNWLAFLTLRADPHAQWEIQQYANAVGEILKQEFPRTWGLFAAEREHSNTPQENKK